MGRPRFQDGEATKVPWVLKGKTIELIHVFDEWGSHRLTLNGRLGDWARYTDIAYLKVDDRLFGATTDYHTGVIDPGEVFEVQTILPRTLGEVYGKG
jgi:hypothetical protein